MPRSVSIPLHPALTRDGTARSYNFALAGAPWQMNFCALEYVLATTPARRVVLGIHAQPLPAFDCSESIADMHETAWISLLLSPRALGAAIETVAHQRRTERGSHTREGLYYYSRFDPGVERRFSQYFASILHDVSGCSFANLQRSVESPAQPLTVAADAPFDVEGLARIVDSVSGRDVTLRLPIYPRHALSIETDYLCGRQMDRWRALWHLAHYLEQHPPAPPASVEIWDFQGYGPYTTEPVAPALMSYWQDPEHFNFEFGNVMLDWMFDRVPGAATRVDGLGYRVTTVTLAERYEWFSQRAHRVSRPPSRNLDGADADAAAEPSIGCRRWHGGRVQPRAEPHIIPLFAAISRAFGMQLYTIGINHHTAPLSVREQVAFAGDGVGIRAARSSRAPPRAGSGDRVDLQPHRALLQHRRAEGSDRLARRVPSPRHSQPATLRLRAAHRRRGEACFPCRQRARFDGGR